MSSCSFAGRPYVEGRPSFQEGREEAMQVNKYDLNNWPCSTLYGSCQHFRHDVRTTVQRLISTNPMEKDLATLTIWNVSYGSFSDWRAKRKSPRSIHLRSWNALKGTPLTTGESTTDTGSAWVNAASDPFLGSSGSVAQQNLFESSTTSERKGASKLIRANSIKTNVMLWKKIIEISWKQQPSSVRNNWFLIWFSSYFLKNREGLICTNAAPHVPIPPMLCLVWSNLLVSLLRRWNRGEPAQKTRIHHQEQMHGKSDFVRYPACAQSTNHRRDQSSENLEPVLMFPSSKEVARYISSAQLDSVIQSWPYTRFPLIELIS